MPTVDPLVHEITRRREERGWSMAELARRSGISLRCVWAAHHGHRGITLHTLRALAAALDLEPVLPSGTEDRTMTAATQRQHGTHARYHHGPNEYDQPGGCRCSACRNANTTYQQQRRRSIAYGRWPTHQYLDATPVRNHLHQLQAAHIDLKHVATTTGLSTNTVWRIAAGRTVKVRPRIHAAILAINPHNGGPRVSHIGIQRRARALARLGWTITHQAQLLRISPFTYREIVAGTARTWPTHKAAAVHALFNKLAWATPPTGWIAERARRNAARAGWPPPAAWDDDTIDNPNTQPHDQPARSLRFADDIDDHAVEAACAGARTWSSLSRGEKTATIAHLDQHGWTRSRIARHLNISGATVAGYLDGPAAAPSSQEAA